MTRVGHQGDTGATPTFAALGIIMGVPSKFFFPTKATCGSEGMRFPMKPLKAVRRRWEVARQSMVAERAQNSDSDMNCGVV